MKSLPIGFIGGGNMARSLVGGLIADGYAPDHIHVADPDAAHTKALHSDFGVRIAASNQSVVDHCAIVMFAVKPQIMQAVATALVVPRGTQRLYISIAAGIRSADLDRWLGGGQAIVRTMPNTPALVQSGATALYANAQVSDTQRDTAESILRAVGLTLWLEDEALMDAVTALSGSGPAYFFLVMEALEAGGRQLGLPAETARLLTLQTAFGAAKMALESAEDSATLRQRVTSPGGTTERALDILRAGKLPELFAKALGAARDRAAELADQLGK